MKDTGDNMIPVVALATFMLVGILLALFLLG